MFNGVSVRYQRNAYDRARKSGRLYVNLGGTAEVKTFVPYIGMKVFFVLQKKMKR